MRQLHAYFDYGSPYSYLAWRRITQLHPDRYANCEVLWKPVSAWHLFASEGTQPNAKSPNRGRYDLQDAARWAELYAVPMAFPKSYPTRTLEAARLTFLADQGGPAAEAEWMRLVFEAHWVEGRDIADMAVLTELCQRMGMQDAPTSCNQESLKRLLAANTQEAYDAGAPGVPFFVLEDEMFWGNDRLDWVEMRLAQ